MISKTLYQYLGTDKIMSGIYDWLMEVDNGLMAALGASVKIVEGNGVKYNVETADPVLSWIDVGDDVPEIQHTFEQRSAALYRFAGDAFVDKMRQAMVPTTEADEIKSATRALYRQWLQKVIYGQTTVLSSTKQIKGLFRLVAEIEGEAKDDLDAPNNSQVVSSGTDAGTALTLSLLDQTMDQVKLGCNALIMSAQTKRKIETLTNAAGTPLIQTEGKYSHRWREYNGAKIYVVDAIKNNLPDMSSSILTISTYNTATTWASGSADNAIIFAAHIGDDGLCMIEPPGGKFTKETPFTSPEKDAFVHRFKAYTGLACYNKFGLAALIGITADVES